MLKRWVWTALIMWMALGSAHAIPTLLVDGTGKLIGADGVDVGGALYDVRFVDASCISVFSGCDSTADFNFTTLADAFLASQALLDQVFVDGIAGQFDSNPGSTVLGCFGPFVCQAVTPFGIFVPESPSAWFAVNHPFEPADSVVGMFIPAWHPVDLDMETVFAVWSVQQQSVDEPSAIACLAFGLGALAWARRRRKQGPRAPQLRLAS